MCNVHPLGSNCLAASASEAGRVWRDMHGSEAEQQLEDSWSPGLTTYPPPCATWALLIILLVSQSALKKLPGKAISNTWSLSKWT